MDVQQPDNLRTGLAAAKRDDVATDRIIEQGALILVGLERSCQPTPELNTRRHNHTLGRTLAISWLPVTESARSTIIARRPLRRRQHCTMYLGNMAYPFAGSHMRAMIRSKVSFPPSFKAFVTDLAPCSLVEYSRRPEMRCSRAMF